MEGVGIKLKNAREAKKLSIKEISKETNISSSFLLAMENEEFEKLPGETYVIGYLRNYAEFLKLDTDEIIQFYKGNKIGESVTPLEELTKPTTPQAITGIVNLFNQYKTIFYISSIALFLVLVIWIFNAVNSYDIDVENENSIDMIKKEYNNTKESENSKIQELKLNNSRGYILLYENESVRFSVNNKMIAFQLDDIDENRVELVFSPGNLRRTFEIEKPEVLSIKDYQREIVITLKGLTEKRAKIFVMLGKKILASSDEVKETGIIENSASDGNAIDQNSENLKIIFEAVFIQKTYLELYLDGEQKKKGIIPSGERARWEASEYIQLKIGNAGGMRAKINGKAYNFGRPGEVVNKVVTWKKDINNPNLYSIVVKDW